MIPKAEKDAFLAAKVEDSSYVINPGDQIQIEVWQQANLTRTVTVRPDGKITLPLVNDVPAGGLTVPQFQTKLTERLKTYLKDPIVSITMNQVTGKQIYVQGEVRTPAAFGYRGDIYLLQVISQAGGLSSFSDKCAVIVRQKNDQFLRYDVNLEPIMEGTSMKENILLLPNDVVTVH